MNGLIVKLLTSNRFLVSIVLVECESLQSVTIITIITIDTHVDTSLDCTRAENVDIVVSSSSTHLTGKNVIKHQMHDLQETLMVLVDIYLLGLSIVSCIIFQVSSANGYEQGRYRIAS